MTWSLAPPAHPEFASSPLLPTDEGRNARPSSSSRACPGQHDHRVRLLRQWPTVESAADLIAREAGGAQQQLHLGLVRPPHQELRALDDARRAVGLVQLDLV